MQANFISNAPSGKDFCEGNSQGLVAQAMFDCMSGEENLPHIIGLEGPWGSGKSNVIKQLEKLPGFSDDYYLFTYDAWGHQEDLQRRSILEVLTTDLIKSGFLTGIGEVRLRNGELKKDKWRDLLCYLLSNKSVKTTKPEVRVTWFAMLACLIILISTFTTAICREKFFGNKFEDYLLIYSIPYCLGIVLVFFYTYQDCSFKAIRQWVAKSEAEKVTEEYVSSEEPSVQEFRNWMQAISDYIAKENKRKLILIFDNMDRLTPDKVKQLWSSIYAFFAGTPFENIWVIVPYDENHLQRAFNSLDANDDNFIRKTFSMVYRVSPPVISDYNRLFNSYFKKAFGEHDEKSKISQVFRVLNPNPNPRDVIYFLNQMVSIVKVWDKNIPLADVALYVCRKISRHRDIAKVSLDSYLLSDRMFENVSPLFVQKEKTKVNLTKMAYGLTKDEMAAELPMYNKMRSCLSKGIDGDINAYVHQTHFVDVLEKVVNEVSLSEVDRYIVSLGRLNFASFDTDTQSKINSKWDHLANLWLDTQLESQSLDDVVRQLLLHVSDNRRVSVMEHFVSQIQNFDVFDGANYYHAMNDFRNFIESNNLEYDFESMDKVVTDAKNFVDYLNLAMENYKRFGLSVDNNELLDFLSKSDFKDMKRPSLINYLDKDEYDLTALLDDAQKLITENRLNLDNICTVMYVVSYVLYDLRGEIISDDYIPSTATFNSLYASVITQNENKPKDGYTDFLLVAIYVFGQNLDCDNEMVQKMADQINKYSFFGEIFDNIQSVSQARRDIAKAIIEGGIKGHLDLLPLLRKLETIKDATAVEWQQLLKYCSSYIADFTEADLNVLRSNFSENIPSSLFIQLKSVDCNFTSFIVNEGVKLLEEEEHFVINSSGNVLPGYWCEFVKAFLGGAYWRTTDDFLLGEIDKVVSAYCVSPNFALFNNDFVRLLIDKAKFEDLVPSVNKLRNTFVVGTRCASANEFLYFAPLFIKLGGNIADVPTFMQNFVESAFLQSAECRLFVFEQSDYFMPLVNQSSHILSKMIKYIDGNKSEDDICGKLYDKLSEDTKESLKPKEDE